MNINEKKEIDHAAAKGEASEKRVVMSPDPPDTREFIIAWTLLRQMLTAGLHTQPSYTVIKDGVPADAELICARANVSGGVVLTISSDEFSEVVEGASTSDLVPTLRIIHAAVEGEYSSEA